MTKYAVVNTGGKQYLVKENDEIIVDRINGSSISEKSKTVKVNIDKLAEFDDEKDSLQIGTPVLKEKVSGEIVSQLKGDKIRVAKFKAKVRYRKVMGFRARLTKLKIVKIG